MCGCPATQQLPRPPLAEVRAVGHPPLKGEGWTAEGSPGWGDSHAAYVEGLSPPPGPLARPTSPLQGEVFVIGAAGAIFLPHGSEENSAPCQM
jgi:hypothetical protein